MYKIAKEIHSFNVDYWNRDLTKCPDCGLQFRVDFRDTHDAYYLECPLCGHVFKYVPHREEVPLIEQFLCEQGYNLQQIDAIRIEIQELLNKYKPIPEKYTAHKLWTRQPITNPIEEVKQAAIKAKIDCLTLPYSNERAKANLLAILDIIHVYNHGKKYLGINYDKIPKERLEELTNLHNIIYGEK